MGTTHIQTQELKWKNVCQYLSSPNISCIKVVFYCPQAAHMRMDGQDFCAKSMLMLTQAVLDRDHVLYDHCDTQAE